MGFRVLPYLLAGVQLQMSVESKALLNLNAGGCIAYGPHHLRQRHLSCVRATNGEYQLPPLPYAADALEPHIDTQTMQIHHGKHHQTFINNLNGLEGIQGQGFPDVESLQAGAVKAGPAVRNNGGGHYNHGKFWTFMAPPDKTGTPSAELEAAIVSAFGSMDAMKEQFNKAAATRFGSGWAWIGVKPDGKLGITSTANQDNPLMEGLEYPMEPMRPIVGLDVWEHAYYLKYQNRRPEYINAFWNVVNWNQVNENYKNEMSKMKSLAEEDSPVSIPIMPLLCLLVASGFAFAAMHSRRCLLAATENPLVAK